MLLCCCCAQKLHGIVSKTTQNARPKEIGRQSPLHKLLPFWLQGMEPEGEQFV